MKKFFLIIKLAINAVKETSLERFYDRSSEKYADIFGEIQEEFSESMIHLLKSEGSRRYDQALDLGCGTGILTRKIQSHYQNCTGVDFSKGMLQKASMNDDEIEYVHSNVLDLPLEAKRFDLIACLGVVTHILPKDFERFVSEINRVSKEEADIIIGIPPFPWRLFYRRRIPMKVTFIDRYFSIAYNWLQSILGMSERVGLYDEKSFIEAFSEYGFQVSVHDIDGLAIVFAKRSLKCHK